MSCAPNLGGRVLVLGGGGAKGAYAFGCLKAFRERGITFDAVAGASAGALNALAWSTGSFAEAEELWLTMSFKTVYPFKILGGRMMPEFVRRAISILYVVARILWSVVIGMSVPKRKLGSLGAAVVVAMMMTPMLVVGLELHLGAIAITFCVFTLVMYLLIYGNNHIFRKYASILFTQVMTLRLIMVMPVALRDHPVLTTICILMFGTLIVLFLNWLFGRKMAVLSQSGLAMNLEKVLQRPMTVPVTVALSREAKVNDPDDPHYYYDSVPPTPGQTAFPDTRRIWITEYVRLDTLDHNTVKETCLASAALPFGIVPPVTIAKTTYVDGGLTDNVPVFPFIDASCTEVFVVLLEPAKRTKQSADRDRDLRRASGFDEKKWSERDRAVRVANYPVRYQTCGADWGSKNRPPTILPYRFPTFMPKPSFFYPDESLGTFFSGTLNFNGKYAKDLIKKGHQETLRRLDENGPSVLVTAKARGKRE